MQGENGEGPRARFALLQMGVQLVHPHVVEGQVVVGVAQLQVAGGRGTEMRVKISSECIHSPPVSEKN